MPQPKRPSGPADASESSKPDPARSGGDRSPAGSNYGDWRPKPPAPDTGSPRADEMLPPGPGLGNPPGPGPGSGSTPTTQPSGIGSTPHK